MSIFDSYGPSFSLDDTKAAKRLATNSYDTAVDIPSVRVIGGDPEIFEALLEGDDQTTDASARMKSMTVNLEFGSLSLSALAVLLGITNVSGILSGSNYLAQVWGKINPPYVGLCGRALQSGGDGDLHLFWPMAKVTSISGIQMQQDNYIIPNATLRALYDSTYGYFVPIRNETARAIAIPPLNAPQLS